MASKTKFLVKRVVVNTSALQPSLPHHKQDRLSDERIVTLIEHLFQANIPAIIWGRNNYVKHPEIRIHQNNPKLELTVKLLEDLTNEVVNQDQIASCWRSSLPGHRMNLMRNLPAKWQLKQTSDWFVLI